MKKKLFIIAAIAIVSISFNQVSAQTSGSQGATGMSGTKHKMKTNTDSTRAPKKQNDPTTKGTSGGGWNNGGNGKGANNNDRGHDNGTRGTVRDTTTTPR